MASPIEVLARTGYAARGVVYLVIGYFAVRAALGSSEAKGTEAALVSIVAQPFGNVLLWIVAFGMAAFCVWRLVQALRDTDDHGSDGKGLAVRAALVGSALSYAGVGLLAVAIARGTRRSAESGGGGDPTGGWLAAIHDAGFGWMLTYGVTALFFAVGAAHVVKGVRAGFEKYFRCGEDVMRWVRPLSRFGLIARGVVFLIIGVLVFSGGRAYEAADRPGVLEALQSMQGFSFGWIVLLVIALGLLAFGIYSLAEARYRHVSPT